MKNFSYGVHIYVTAQWRILAATKIIMMFGTVLVFVLPESLWAGCKEEGLEAQRLCSSQDMVSRAQSAIRKVETSIDPRNGRMSPESCQALRHGYNEFKSLAQDYKRQCESQVAKARQTCVNSRPETGEFEDDLVGTLATRAGLKHLPVLDRYIQAMDRLNARLKDCLRDTPGEIAVTNTDRGNARSEAKVRIDSAGQQTTEVGTSFFGSQTGQSMDQNGRSFLGSQKYGATDVSNICSDPALSESSMCAPGGEFAGSSRQEFAKANPMATLAGRSGQLSDRTGLTGASDLPGSMGTGPKRRSPSSLASLGSTEISNRHSNLFLKVRRMYRQMKPTLLPN